MKYNTAIFDLDGTLLNTLDDLTASVNYAMRGMNFPEHTLDEVRRFVGNGVRVLIRRSVPVGTSETEYESAYKLFEGHYAENCRNKTAPYDGILQMLGELKKKGCQLAIVSNKIDFAVKKLSAEFFGSVIDIAVGDCPDTNNKPAPDMVYKAMNAMGGDIKPVYIGDTDVDLETAKNAGMDCISVSWGFRSREELEGYRAAMIADKPSDIIKFIEG